MSRQKLARALLLAFIAVAALPAPSFAQSPFATEMSAGREAFDGSNYALADRHFHGALDVAASDGQKSAAHYSLAVSAQRQGRNDEAKERAQKALDLSPKSTQAQRLLEELGTSAQRQQAPQPKTTKQAAGPAQAAPGMTAPLPTTLVDQIPQRKAAPAPAKEPAVKETPPKEQVAAAPKETPAVKAKAAPAAKAPPPPAPVAAASASKLDPTTIGTLEANGARLLWTLPADKRAVLGAGFAAADTHVVIVSGPMADAPAGEIELKRYDLATGKPGDGYSLHSDLKTAIVAVPPSGGILATAVTAERSAKKNSKAAPVSLHLWNGETVDNTEAIEMEGSDRGSGIALDQLEFSRNGKRLVAAHRSGVEVFDTAGLKGVNVFRLASRRDAASARPAMAVSANSSRIVLTNGARIRVLEGSSNVRDIGPGGSGPAFDRIALSDNGSLIAASSAAGIRFYETGNGKEVEALPYSPDVVAALAFSPGGERLAVASGALVQIWTMQGRKSLIDLQNAGPVERLAFSNDGRLLLAAGEQGTRIWYIDPDTIAPSTPSASNIVTSSVTKPAAAAAAPAKVEVLNAEPAKTAEAVKPAEAAKPAEPQKAAEAPAQPAAPAAVAAAKPPAAPAPSDPAVARAMDPTVEKARRVAELSVERAGAFERNDCDRVKVLDAEIGSGALHGTCTGRVDQARREADRKQKEVLGSERTAALERRDCDRVKTLDNEIGGNALFGTCTARVDQARRDTERQQKDTLVSERAAAIAAHKCDEVKSLDAKIGDGDHHASCAFQAVVKTGTARELYLAAARYDADRDRTSAKQLYRAIVDRFPLDDLAIRAAERMTLLSDMEAREKPAAVDAAVEPVRREQRRQRSSQR